MKKADIIGWFEKELIEDRASLKKFVGTGYIGMRRRVADINRKERWLRNFSKGTTPNMETDATANDVAAYFEKRIRSKQTRVENLESDLRSTKNKSERKVLIRKMAMIELAIKSDQEWLEVFDTKEHIW